MKIFNWMHRKIHNNVEGYVVSPKKDDFLGKPESVTNETADTNSLLNHATLWDVWKDGMLTIGTLGYEYSISKEEKQEHDEEEEAEAEAEAHSAANKAQTVSVVKVIKPEQEKVACLKPETVNISGSTANVGETPTPTPTPETTPLLEHVVEKKRVTLADLLSVELDVAKKSKMSKLAVVVDVDKKSASKMSAGTEKKTSSSVLLSFGKKHKGEDSGPKRKLHRMISKMWKKKIYPDVEGKNNGKDDATKKTVANMTAALESSNLSHGGRTVEMVSLLQGVVSQS